MYIWGSIIDSSMTKARRGRFVVVIYSSKVYSGIYFNEMKFPFLVLNQAWSIDIIIWGALVWEDEVRYVNDFPPIHLFIPTYVCDLDQNMIFIYRKLTPISVISYRHKNANELWYLIYWFSLQRSQLNFQNYEGKG